MLAEKLLCATIFLLTTGVLFSQGGNVDVLFAENDASGSEASAAVLAPVRVSGSAVGSIIVTVVPLTVAGYQAQSSTYESSCDNAISSDIDQAEEEDFDISPVHENVTSDSLSTTGQKSFNMRIDIHDDSTREAEEYFLLWLNASTSDEADSITFMADRRCIRVSIGADQDAISLNFTALVTEVSESVGTVEVLRVEKQGDTELPIMITFSGSNNVLTVSPSSITLEPEDTSTVVNITVMDDKRPEDDIEYTINAEAGTFGSGTIPITVKDDDNATIGFDQTEVTVIEGETVRLTATFKNNLTDDQFDRAGLFAIHTQTGKGNASESEHYTSFSEPFYFPGDPIEIVTIDDNKLERARQFEVRLTDPSLNPLNVLNPNHVIITIKDNDGIPNKPMSTSIAFDKATKGDISVAWMIKRDELRPIQRYTLIFMITTATTVDDGSKPGEEGDKDGEVRDGADGDEGKGETESRQFNVTVDASEITCTVNRLDHDCKHLLTNLERETKVGERYNVIVCAENEFGTMCGEPTTPVPVPAPLSPSEESEDGLPPNVIVGIVIGVVALLLLCCLLWFLIILLCCCCWAKEREKKYLPAKREKENEEQLEKYRRVNTSESPDIPDKYNYYV